MKTKFPCDTCEKRNVSHFVCEKFVAYVFKYPTSRKAMRFIEQLGKP